MKKMWKVIYVCMGLFLFSGCATTTPFVAQEPAELAAVSKIAVELTEMVKTGGLVPAPFVSLDSSKVDLKNIAGYDKFFMQNIVILDANYSSNGTFSQQMLIESRDRTGRIELRDDRIAFKLKSTSPDEVALISKGFRKISSEILSGQLSTTGKAALAEAVSKYQQENGLKVDGIYGKNTADFMAKKSVMINIEEITSDIVYLPEPRHATYIVPFSIVDKNPDKFYKGFDSLEMVKQAAIGLKDFRGLAKKGAQFTVFVYFFDHVDPYTPLSLRISKSRLKATGSAGQRWYADPVEWPVLVETFTLEKDPKSVSSNLYLNVCLENTESNRCISSRQIR